MGAVLEKCSKEAGHAYEQAQKARQRYYFRIINKLTEYNLSTLTNKLKIKADNAAKSGFYDMAISNYSMAIDLNSSDLEESIEQNLADAYSKAIAVDPANEHFYKRLAFIKYDQVGNLSHAELLKKGEELKEQFEEAFYNSCRKLESGDH